MFQSDELTQNTNIGKGMDFETEGQIIQSLYNELPVPEKEACLPFICTLTLAQFKNVRFKTI